MTPDIRAWLTNLYPRPWRERYADEFEAMLEQCLKTPLDIVDVILGAVDAHLQLINGENVNWRLLNMINKLRTTILIVFASFIGFVVAGMALNGMLDDSPMIPYMRDNLASAVALSIVQLGAVVALLAVVVGGLPLALTVIRRARSVDPRNRGLLLVPAYSLLALVLYFGFIFLVATGRINIPGVVQVVQPDNFPVGNRLMLAGLMLIFVLGAIASTVAVWKVLSRTDVEQDTFKAAGRTLNIDIYKFAYIPAVITAVCMLVMLVATLVWSWLVFSAMPKILAGEYGLWQTSTQAWLYGIIVVMAICSLTAILGVARGRTAMAQA